MELSIIVPVYNAEHYLAACMESLVALKISDYEVIVINDGSTDGSQSIIEQYAVRYPQLVKSFSQPNSGVSCARNLGLSKATGNYIGFVDSDDYLLPDAFTEFWNRAKNLNLDVAVANLERDYDGKAVPDDLSRAKRRRLEKLGTVTGQAYMAASYNYLKDDLKVEPVTKFYRRAFLLERQLQFKPGIRYEDTLFVMQALLCAQHVHYFDCNIYRYRMHPDSFMSQQIGTLQIESLWVVASELYSQIGQVGAAKYVYDSQLVSLVYLVYRYGGLVDVKKAKEILKRTGFVTPKATIKKIIMLCHFR